MKLRNLLIRLVFGILALIPLTTHCQSNIQIDSNDITICEAANGYILHGTSMSRWKRIASYTDSLEKVGRKYDQLIVVYDSLESNCKQTFAAYEDKIQKLEERIEYKDLMLMNSEQRISEKDVMIAESKAYVFRLEKENKKLKRNKRIKNWLFGSSVTAIVSGFVTYTILRK